MAKKGLRSVVVRKYRHYSDNAAIPNDKENIIKWDFTADTINKKWCTDITDIYVAKEGWTYMACVMDLYACKIIGYAYGTAMTAELALKALQNACLNNI